MDGLGPGLTGHLWRSAALSSKVMNDFDFSQVPLPPLVLPLK